jgi:adenylosuccinate synthase
MGSLAVLGCAWGDEGKAKIVDVLAEKADVVCRFQGGSNAGHTICAEGRKYVFHTAPSGLLYPNVACVIGAGVVIDPFQLLSELDALEAAGIILNDRLRIDPRATMVLPVHRELDGRNEDRAGGARIGTTRQGIGPAYADRASRIALQMGDLAEPSRLRARIVNLYAAHELEIAPGELDDLIRRLSDAAKRLVPCFEQAPYYLDAMHRQGKTILFEGAQGSLLDLFFGVYPYVTSSSTIAGGICTGAGFPPHKVDRLIGVYKSYFSRVGEGPFPTELDNPTGQRLRDRGHEYGSTTGRPRRCGWFDAVAARYTAMLNGLDEIALTLLDVLGGFETVRIATAYRIGDHETIQFPAMLDDIARAVPVYLDFPGWEDDISHIRLMKDLPENARRYVEAVGDLLGVRVTIVSVGSDRTQTIFR